jgi:hypothetical protein
MYYVSTYPDLCFLSLKSDSPRPRCPNHQQKFFSRKRIRRRTLRLDGSLLHLPNGRKQVTCTNKPPMLSGSRSNSSRLVTHSQGRLSAEKTVTRPTMQQMPGGMLPSHTRRMTLSVCSAMSSMQLILIWMFSGDTGFEQHNHASH